MSSSHLSSSSAVASSPKLLAGLGVSARVFLCLGALSAGASVVFSAAFAHLPVFAAGMPTAVQTALSQQQFHALGLLLVGLALGHRPASRALRVSGGLMLVGLVLFSFNLYARHIWGFDTFRALVPWGGSAWIAAWLCLAGAFVRADTPVRLG